MCPAVWNNAGTKGRLVMDRRMDLGALMCQRLAVIFFSFFCPWHNKTTNITVARLAQDIVPRSDNWAHCVLNYEKAYVFFMLLSFETILFTEKTLSHPVKQFPSLPYQ